MFEDIIFVVFFYCQNHSFACTVSIQAIYISFVTCNTYIGLVATDLLYVVVAEACLLSQRAQCAQLALNTADTHVCIQQT